MESKCEIGAKVLNKDELYKTVRLTTDKYKEDGLYKGMVDNYEHPDDYAKHFIDINVGYNAGFDHCWNPLEKHDSATQATAVTFSSGSSYGVGYDYYFGPKQILDW